MITEGEAQKDWKDAAAQGQAALDRTASVLGTEVEVRLVPANERAGAVLDQVAGEIAADVIVVGSSSKGNGC